jgi:hypothetical protein
LTVGLLPDLRSSLERFYKLKPLSIKVILIPMQPFVQRTMGAFLNL